MKKIEGGKVYKAVDLNEAGQIFRKNYGERRFNGRMFEDTKTFPKMWSQDVIRCNPCYDSSLTHYT